MSDVTLSKAVRSNLLHLQNTAQMMDRTQERLATGKKVNSALDNPTNFFTASSLNARAADIGTLLDAMSNGIQTIEAADNGLTAITKTLESMQSTLRQARQDNTFQMTSFTLPKDVPFSAGDQLSFSGGNIDTPANVALTKPASGSATIAWSAAGSLNDDGDTISFDVTLDGGAPQSIVITGADIRAIGNGDYTIDSAEEFAALIEDKISGATVELNGNAITITSDTLGANSRVDIGAATVDDTAGGATATLITNLNLGLGAAIDGAPTMGAAEGGANKTVDELVSEINTQFKGQLRASNDRGMLRIENLSTTPLKVGGASGDIIDGSPMSEATIDGNTTRSALADQFNSLRSELDRLAEDASYNGVNLLRGDDLKIVFNEMGTSLITIETKDAHGNPRPINSNEIGLLEINPADLETDEKVDELLHNVQLALGEVRAQASDLGSTLSVVQNREQFTREMINTLQSGAANLTLADSNEEAANMLALQTRQQLSQTALSLASQADQSVLRLFG
ncbi:flagellin [Pelagibacterium sediminicola]|uniref:flagellin N-terminal helical domain-containing protein n=1 Tax=Pelagibacterium sediminicola TaxID=2248761 RepID=UPI0018E563C2|nr:flagellin [Pelagibacterium sediminicola]